jgi:hypothetical protein
MLCRAPPHHMKQVHTRLERTHHAGRGLVEHPARNVIQQMTFELKVDVEINLRRVPDRTERPRVCQVLERPVDGVNEHLSRSIQRDVTRETFLEWAEPDDEFGDDLSLVLAVQTRTAAPWNERGIIFHICHDCEKLVGAVLERRPLLVMWHVTHLPLSTSPAMHRLARTDAPL